MRPVRVYLDTSVIGGLFDRNFAKDSRRLFEAIRSGRAVAMISPVVTDELEGAPEPVRQVLGRLPSGSIIPLEETEQVNRLAAAYLRAGVVTERYQGDAAHIAFATVYEAHVVASWNFRHIVNLHRIQQFNSVNLARGYRTLEIRSPLELFIEEEENDGRPGDAGG